MKEIATPEQLLTETAKILEKRRIRYFITGGIAVTVWGKPRFTADIDIVIAIPSEKTALLLVEELKKIDSSIYVEPEAAIKAIAREGEFNLIHPNTGLKIDFWILKNNAFDKNRIKRAQAKKLKGQKIYFTSPEDLILIKLLWYKESGSSKHLEDAQSVLKFSKVNFAYLKKWAKKQLTFTILKKFHEFQ
jgi:hypothetical protein